MKVIAPFVRAVAARLHTRIGLALAGSLVAGSLALAQTVAPALYTQSLPATAAGLVRLPAIDDFDARAISFDEDAPLPDGAPIPAPPTSSRIRAQAAVYTESRPLTPPVTQSQGVPVVDAPSAPSPAHNTSPGDAPLPDASLSLPPVTPGAMPHVTVGQFTAPKALPKADKLAPLPDSLPTANDLEPPPPALAPVPPKAFAADDGAPDAAEAPLPQLEAGAGEPTADKLGIEPANNSLEFLRSVSVLLEPGQMEVDYGLEYVWQNNPGLLLGDTNNDGDLEALGFARFRNRQLFVPFAFRYGLTDRTQLFASLPVGGALFEQSNAAFNDFNSVGGTGDLRFGLNYLWREHDACSPDIVFNFELTAPTGADQYDRGALQAFLGEGFWAAAGSVTVIKSIDPVVLFTVAGAQHLFGEEHQGLYIEPGERFFIAFGVGFAINDSVTFSTTFQDTLETTTLVDNVAIPDSSLEPMTIRMAVTAFLSECQIAEPFVRFALNDDAPQVDCGLTLTRRY